MNIAQQVHTLKEEGASQALARAQVLEAEDKDIIHLEVTIQAGVQRGS